MNWESKAMIGTGQKYGFVDTGFANTKSTTGFIFISGGEPGQ
jgi:hypothetical protein